MNEEINMILESMYGHVSNIDIVKYHIETAFVKSDDLYKSILRVKTDHGNEYGIRLKDKSKQLEDGTIFQLNNHNLLLISVLPDNMIVISPENIEQMGTIAHLIGNLHKPVKIENSKIFLNYDKTVEKTLLSQKIKYSIEDIKLKSPLKYVDFSNGK